MIQLFLVRLAVVAQDVGLQAEQLAQAETHRAAGADIFGAGQLLFDKAKQVGFGLAARFLVLHGDIAHAVQQASQRNHGEDGKGQPGAPVFAEQGDQDADQQQAGCRCRVTTNCEKKLAISVTSPSMRSISSPGVWSLWKLMSRFRQCQASSARRALVAVQATFSPR